ncbi:odorant receptor 30a-like [Xylocopa sonorina]|uniref:odorant receptor 30a-like n=1 Tax=Xylocopa sonorina TaxID=1818115 RepID=UPI00403B074F
MLKYTVLLYRTDEFRKVLHEIRDDWFNAMEGNRAIFRTKAKIGQNMVMAMAIIMYTSGICYRTLPLSKGRIVLPGNTTMRLLPCPSYFVFFNEQASPYYEIIFIMQLLEGMLMYTIFCGTLGAFAVLSLHICSLLVILMNKMIELTNQSDVSEDGVHRKIFDIIECQTKIKRFMNDMNKITQYLCFIEIFVDTCNFCTSGYCLITVQEWKQSNSTNIAIYFSFQALNVYTIFMMCYIGQLVIDESNNVRLTSVTLNWYRFPMKKARCLIPVIIVSSYPIKLTAGKVVDVSLNTFIDVSNEMFASIVLQFSNILAS